MAGMLWAALEALFAAPGDPDRIQVVDRATDVALVAMVRTSIQVSLGSLYSRCPGEALTQRLVAIDLPDRLIELEAALRSGEHEAIAHPGTRVSLIHTARFFDPDILKKRRQEITHVLRGLYRQRNLILHGGVTDSPLLDGIIRASTPLVTAIVNRYARASGEGILDPHVFAYQMHVRLENYLVNPKQIVSVF
jgi:hypothetical protein